MTIRRSDGREIYLRNAAGRLPDLRCILARVGLEKLLKVRRHYIVPRKPIQRGYVESFNGQMQDEGTNRGQFTSLPTAAPLQLGRTTSTRAGRRRNWAGSPPPRSPPTCQGRAARDVATPQQTIIEGAA